MKTHSKRNLRSQLLLTMHVQSPIVTSLTAISWMNVLTPGVALTVLDNSSFQKLKMCTVSTNDVILILHTDLALHNLRT